MKLIKEHFTSIHQMLSVIESRPNNKVMANEDESVSGDRSFTMTRSYDEAKALFETGYTDILDKIKVGVASNLKKTQNINRRTVRTNVIGYAPHVPNAILGLPNSMIMTEQQQQKIRSVSIVIGITESCDTDVKEFVRSGIAALSVVNTLELRGYRVALKVSFSCACCGDEIAWGTITLKDYREHLDIQKLCFPLCHPSMFRRFGFKWLETQPKIQNHNWKFAYGRNFHNDDFIKKNFLEPNEFFINLSLTKRCQYDPDKIIETMDLK